MTTSLPKEFLVGRVAIYISIKGELKARWPCSCVVRLRAQEFARVASRTRTRIDIPTRARMPKLATVACVGAVVPQVANADDTVLQA